MLILDKTRALDFIVARSERVHVPEPFSRTTLVAQAPHAAFAWWPDVPPMPAEPAVPVASAGSTIVRTA